MSVNTTPSGLTKSESLHSRISASATLRRGSRNSSPVAAQRSPRARSASGRGSPTLNYTGRRHGTRSTLSSPGRRSTAASPAATLERGSPECRRSCAASPFSSYASLDRRTVLWPAQETGGVTHNTEGPWTATAVHAQAAVLTDVERGRAHPSANRIRQSIPPHLHRQWQTSLRWNGRRNRGCQVPVAVTRIGWPGRPVCLQ